MCLDRSSDFMPNFSRLLRESVSAKYVIGLLFMTRFAKKLQAYFRPHYSTKLSRGKNIRKCKISEIGDKKGRPTIIARPPEVPRIV
jgi:hypothetical protein